MTRRTLMWLAAGATVAGLAACSSPSLRSLYAPQSIVLDSQLPGEWVTDGPTVTRVTVSEAEGGLYAGSMTIHHEGQFKTALALEIALTRIDEHLFVDLFLAKPDRERLASQYGFLALPVHQFMLMKIEDDTLRVWSFDGDWIRKSSGTNGFATETLPIAGQDVAVITADTESLRRFIAEHADDPGVLSPPVVFHRVRRPSNADQ